jgi:hypothetical protein
MEASRVPMLRCAYIYLGTTVKDAIVAALHHNSAGILFEQDGPAVIPDWRQAPGLGVALRFALERFSLQERDLRNIKKTEWPSYRASTSHSVRKFEATYMCISVQALNEAELFYDAYAYPPGEEDIALHVTLDRHGPDEEVDRKLLRLFNYCVALAAIKSGPLLPP